MNMFETVLSIVFGCSCLIAAFTVKTFYQKPLGVNKVGPPVPLWFGRTIAIIVGVGFLLSAWQELHRR